MFEISSLKNLHEFPKQQYNQSDSVQNIPA